VARQFFLRQQNSQAAEKNRGPSWRRGRTVALLKSKPTTQGGELRETKEPANKNHGNSVAGWRNSRENQPPDSGACGRNLSRRASNPNTQKEKPTTAAAQGVGTRRRRFGREQEHERRRASEENEKTKKQTGGAFSRGKARHERRRLGFARKDEMPTAARRGDGRRTLARSCGRENRSSDSTKTAAKGELGTRLWRRDLGETRLTTLAHEE
jgi:hypothetical protein